MGYNNYYQQKLQGATFLLLTLTPLLMGVCWAREVPEEETNIPPIDGPIFSILSPP